MARFLLLASSHTECGVTYSFDKEKDTYVDSATDLASQFPNKFKAVPGDFDVPEYTPTPVPGAGRQQFPGSQWAAPGGAAGTPAADLGDDHTEHFEDAKLNALKVYKKGRVYSVYDKDGKDVSEEEFTRRDQVEKFLSGYGKE